jgi:hypothetical protein
MGIFTQDALLAQTGQTIGGKTLLTVRYPLINDSGTIAFLGAFPGGGTGIFTQDTLVAQTGQTIDGKTLTFIVDTAPSLKNDGTVAFIAEFSDGSVGVVLATPVPELSTLTLISLGTLGLIGYGWQWRIRREDKRGRESNGD